MSKYIDAEKLIAEIERFSATEYGSNTFGDDVANGALDYVLKEIIPSLQQEQPNNMIQWTGNNLKEVIDFTGKSPKFEEWFKSWEEFETYVHQHNDILKLFCEDGSHYEVPVGAWIVKTPDGYNLPSVAKYVQQEQPEVDLEKEVDVTMKRYLYHITCREEQISFARHFAEWGAIHLNARKEE